MGVCNCRVPNNDIIEFKVDNIPEKKESTEVAQINSNVEKKLTSPKDNKQCSQPHQGMHPKKSQK